MILVIDKTKKKAEQISAIFRYMGVLATPASPLDAIRRISPTYKAVLVVEPNSMPELEFMLPKLDCERLGISTFALSEAVDPRFDMTISHKLGSASVLSAMNKHLSLHKRKPIGEYMLGGIDADVARSHASYLGSRLPFTKTELMILRYLMINYPSPRSVYDVLDHAFTPSRAPEIGGVRTHISVINKKFRTKYGRNLIGHVQGLGYLIITTETARAYSLSALSDAGD